MRKRPFFSIPIATYNRSIDLEIALKRLLAQTYKDFEIIISDDNSMDNTEKMVKSFKDSRIKYYRNYKNLGAVKNIGKVLKYAKGKYVFLHGDDDFLLYDNVLERAHKYFVKNDFGLLRFNYLYQTFDKKNVFDYFRNKFTNSNMEIQPASKPLKILDFIEKIDLYFITGIIFRNPLPTKIKIIESEFIPWFKECYKSILQKGGYYDANHEIIASWSRQEKHPVYYVKNGKLPWENYYEEIKKISGEKYYKKVLEKQLEINVNFLSTIKYNSHNKNLIRYAKRIVQLNPKYKLSLKFWSLLIISILLPKLILRFIREIYIKTVSIKGKPQNLSKIVKRLRELRVYE